MALSLLYGSYLCCLQRSQVLFVLISRSEVQFNSTKMSGEAAHAQVRSPWASSPGSFCKEGALSSQNVFQQVCEYVRTHWILKTCTMPEKWGCSKEHNRESWVCFLPRLPGTAAANLLPCRLPSPRVYVCQSLPQLPAYCRSSLFTSRPKNLCQKWGCLFFCFGISHLLWKCRSSPKYLTQLCFVFFFCPEPWQCQIICICS